MQNDEEVMLVGDTPAIVFEADGDGGVDAFGVASFLTVGFVVKSLAAGAISWAGGKILDGIIGGSGGPSLEQLLKIFAASIRQALQQVIIDQDIRELTRRQTALFLSMDDYEASGGAFRLEVAATEVNELIVGFESYGERTYDLLASSLLLKLSVLQAFTADGHRDETASIQKLKTRYAVSLANAAAHRETLIPSYYGAWGHELVLGDDQVEYYYMYKNQRMFTASCYPRDNACIRQAKKKTPELRERAKARELEERHVPLIKASKALRDVSPTKP